MDERLTAATENAASEMQNGGTGWTTTKRYHGSAYDIRGIEAWLTERAEAGDELIAWNEFRTESGKRRCQFYLEIAAEKGEAPDESLCRKRASLGWEYVCTTESGIFHVWRGDLSAQRPAMQDYSDSYGYRKLRGARWTSFLVPFAYLLGLAAIAGIVYLGSEMPLRALLTMEKTQLVQGLGLVVSGFSAVLSGRRERKNLRALLRAIEEREHVGFLPHDPWERLDKLVSCVFLLIVFILIFVGKDGEIDWVSEQPHPYVGAEVFGGEKAEEYTLREQTTPLGGSIRAVGDGHYAGRVDGWFYFATELDCYAPRIASLATPLAEELRTYFMPHAQEVSLSGADEAYYADEGAQFLLLRRGGLVLLYRTTAPNDLRQSLDVFLQVMEEYEAQ